MKKIIFLFLLFALPLFAQVKRASPFEYSNATTLRPISDLHIFPFSNGGSNLGATGTRWNFLYTDTTITNHLSNTTWTLNSVGVTTTGAQINYLSGATGTTGTTTTNLVFSTSPVFVTPTLGVAAGTSLALGGATIGTNALAVTGTTIISGQTSVGTSILDGILSVVSNAGDVPMVVNYKQFRTSSSFINFDFYKAYGTEASPTSVGSSSGLFQFTANGYATDGFYAAARIGMQVDGLGVGAGDMPGQIFFQTSPDGSATLVTRMIIDNAGTITFGTTKNIGVGAVYAGAITSSGNFLLTDPGTSANSYLISLKADNAGTVQEGQIQVMYGADPYLRLSAPNDAGTATAIMDLKDQRVVIGSSAAGVDYDIYFQGETNQGSITYMEDEDRIDFDNDIDVIGDLTAGTVQSDATVKATTMVGNVAQQTITLGVGAVTFAVTSNVVTVTGDGGANTLATITGGIVGIYTFIFVDALVTITDTDAHTANTVDLAGTATNFTSADDKVLQLVFDGVSFYQISVSAN